MVRLAVEVEEQCCNSYLDGRRVVVYLLQWRMLRVVCPFGDRKSGLAAAATTIEI